MRKIAITVAAIACGASIASAQVSSANLVGYAKVTATGGQLTLVALNFDTGGQTLNELLGDQVPQGSVVNLWDKQNSGYITSTKTRAGFTPDIVVEMGDAFWIAAAGVDANEVVLSGEVLTTGTNTIEVATGLAATGYFYPVGTLWGQTDLSVQAPQGSVLNIWNGASYDTYTKTRAGWGANPALGVSQGFWLSTPSDFTWEEVRPFDF